MMDFQLLRAAEVMTKSDNEEKTKGKGLFLITFKNNVSFTYMVNWGWGGWGVGHGYLSCRKIKEPYVKNRNISHNSIFT